MELCDVCDGTGNMVGPDGRVCRLCTNCNGDGFVPDNRVRPRVTTSAPEMLTREQVEKIVDESLAD